MLHRQYKERQAHAYLLPCMLSITLVRLCPLHAAHLVELRRLQDSSSLTNSADVQDGLARSMRASGEVLTLTRCCVTLETHLKGLESACPTPLVRVLMQRNASIAQETYHFQQCWQSHRQMQHRHGAAQGDPIGRCLAGSPGQAVLTRPHVPAGMGARLGHHLGSAQLQSRLAHVGCLDCRGAPCQPNQPGLPGRAWG